MKVFVAQINPIIGDLKGNCVKIERCIEQAKERGCGLIGFPEMAICGYMPEDLLLENGFVDAISKALDDLVLKTQGISVIVGVVRRSSITPGKPFRNSAAVISDGQLIDFQDKGLLPTYDVFDEWRYFEPAKSERIWQLGGKKIGITICEDIWPTFDSFCQTRYSLDPLECFDGKALDLLINISASPYSLGKIQTRKKVACQVASRLHCPVLIVNQVGAQDGLIFDGSSLLVSAKHELLFQAASFLEECAFFDLDRKTFVKEKVVDPAEELFSALHLGVKDYFSKQGFHKACVGLSGGVDSSLVACIAVEALGKENVLGVLLPSRFTSERSQMDARALAKNLGIATLEVGIEEPFNAFLHTLEPLYGQREMGVAEENIQSRVRGTLLMAISNKEGYLLLNTGNKSELAIGYTTLYGDACGAIAVIGDLLKRQVYQLAHWINLKKEVIPHSVLTREPTAELRENQKDSDAIPEYHILDVIVEEYVVHGKSVKEIASKHGFAVTLVEGVVRKIHASEYKRRQVPFSIRVSDKAFSCGRRVPIVHKYLNTL